MYRATRVKAKNGFPFEIPQLTGVNIPRVKARIGLPFEIPQLAGVNITRVKARIGSAFEIPQLGKNYLLKKIHFEIP